MTEFYLSKSATLSKASSNAFFMDGAKIFQTLPLIFINHQRRPTKRKRQSLKNSGFLPSKAWPMN